MPLILLVTMWNIRERNWSFSVSLEILNKYENLAIANIAPLGSLRTFLLLEKRNIDTWLYVLLTGHITIWHFEKYQTRRIELKDMLLGVYAITPKLLCLRRWHGKILLNELTLDKLASWRHVPVIVLVTIWQNSRKKLKFLGELRNSKQIWEFRNRKYCSTW